MLVSGLGSLRPPIHPDSVAIIHLFSTSKIGTWVLASTFLASPILLDRWADSPEVYYLMSPYSSVGVSIYPWCGTIVTFKI